MIAACYTGVDLLDVRPGGTNASAQTYASLAIELTDASVREFSNGDLMAAWREN